jgi:alpha-L-fucosidase
VKRAAWKDGRGDVVGEFTAACRAEGLKVGLYLSPWDRHEPRYGTDAYNGHFCNQLAELLTQYGPVEEVWFDGACGEGPNGKRQVYDWARYHATIRQLAPRAVIAIMGPDVRWVGNESGVARLGESSVQRPRPDMHGDRPGRVWYPAECDVSIRPGWFYHAQEDTQVKRLPALLDIYFKSVGRNSVLLLNVPPNRHGRFAPPDVGRLREFGAALKELFRTDLALHKPVTVESPNGAPRDGCPPASAVDGRRDTFWAAAEGARSAALVVDLKQARRFNVVSLREPFWLGERVQDYRVEAEAAEPRGGWRTLARGSVIGARNLLSFPETTARRVRLVIEQAKATPALSEFALYQSGRIGPQIGRD